MIFGSGRCQIHSDRVGVGICVECRRVVCAECSTQFEGINRCAQCLEKKLAQSRRPAERREWGWVNVVLGLLAFALVFGGVYWVGTSLSGPG